MLLVHSNIKVINKLVRSSGWLNYARLSPCLKVSQVAQFARNPAICPLFSGGSLCADCWLTLVQIGGSVWCRLFRRQHPVIFPRGKPGTVPPLRRRSIDWQIQRLLRSSQRRFASYSLYEQFARPQILLFAHLHIHAYAHYFPHIPPFYAEIHP